MPGDKEYYPLSFLPDYNQLLFCRMAPEVLQPGSGYNSK